MSGRKIFSFGGGIQSMAVLVLAAKREIEAATFVFANTGDDSENPDTIDYLPGKISISIVHFYRQGWLFAHYHQSSDRENLSSNSEQIGLHGISRGTAPRLSARSSPQKWTEDRQPPV